MKTCFLFFFLFSAFTIDAQNKQYYDWEWKPCNPEDARFVSLTDKTDSGWVKRDFYLSTKKSQMKGLYKDSALKIKNGWFRYFYVNQFVSSQGNYVNGKKDGLWLSYHFNGIIKDSAIYKAGYPTSIIGWHSNGYMSDSSVYYTDGTSLHKYWFDNGQLSHTGESFSTKQDGKWQYFHKNGKVAAVEEYKANEMVSREYYNEAGQPQADTTPNDRRPSFKGGPKKWRSFLMNNLDFLDGVKLVNTYFVTVVLALTIDEAGNITDVYVDVPVSPKFDEQALKVIKKSPAWIPAVDHNRNVKYHTRQSITFGQID
jgi:antitoxin component YwqK of YwqJK toxin-antitoxin module